MLLNHIEEQHDSICWRVFADCWPRCGYCTTLEQSRPLIVCSLLRRNKDTTATWLRSTRAAGDVVSRRPPIHTCTRTRLSGFSLTATWLRSIICFFFLFFLQQARVLKNAKFWSQARMFLTPAWSYVLVVCVLVNSGFLHTFRGDFSQEWLTLGWHALEDFKLNILRQCVLQNASLYRTSIKLCLRNVWPFPSNCIVGSPFVDFSLILRIYSLHIRKREKKKIRKEMRNACETRFRHNPALSLH